MARRSRRKFLGQALGTVGVSLTAPQILGKASEAGAAGVSAPANQAGGLPIESWQMPLQINGKSVALQLEANQTLLDVLRERLGLMGTKKGCDHGQCGACTVLVDGQRIYSCLSLAVMNAGKQITTIEGLATGSTLHPVQSAFIEQDGFQCGYCTPGQICATVAMLAEVKRGCGSAVTPQLTQPPSLASLSESEIKERLSGNLCRCSAYNGIVAAVQQVAGQVPPNASAEVFVQEVNA
jgi:xanthine dehydrogenase YagT iron-sulfur-binding subunit